MCRLCHRVLVIGGFISCLFSSVFAYSGGSGTEANPYRISAVADWNDLMNTTTDWNKYFILTADVNLQGVALLPVGSLGNGFTGVFDGNSHIIRNAKINRPYNYYVGLFGYVGPGGQIRSLAAEDINVTGYRCVGGLVGDNDDSNISDCYTTGTISGGENTGGLIGYNSLGVVTNCYAADTVSSYSAYTGGLIGYNSGSLTGCYADGTVSGNQYAGGLTGYNSGSLADCYARGAVAGNYEYIGGLAGYNNGNLINCYATGSVSGDSNAGGLVGHNYYGSIIESFWDVNTSGRTISDGGEGKTTEQMQDANTFLNASWDFNTPVWKICDGTDYPKLAWQKPLIPGDFVCPDGVAFADLAYFCEHWLLTECDLNNDCDRTDMNTDGTVNFIDFALFADNWLEGI